MSAPPILSPQPKRRRRFPDLPHHVFDPRAPFVARLHFNNLESEVHAKRTKGEDRGVIGLGRFDQTERKENLRNQLAELRKPTRQYNAPRPDGYGTVQYTGNREDDHFDILDQEVRETARRPNDRANDAIHPDDGIATDDEDDSNFRNDHQAFEQNKAFRLVEGNTYKSEGSGVEKLDRRVGASNGLEFVHPDVADAGYNSVLHNRSQYPPDHITRAAPQPDIRVDYVGNRRRPQPYLQNVIRRPQPIVDNSAVAIDGIRGAQPAPPEA